MRCHPQPGERRCVAAALREAGAYDPPRPASLFQYLQCTGTSDAGRRQEDERHRWGRIKPVSGRPIQARCWRHTVFPWSPGPVRLTKSGPRAHPQLLMHRPAQPHRQAPGQPPGGFSQTDATPGTGAANAFTGVSSGVARTGPLMCSGGRSAMFSNRSSVTALPLAWVSNAAGSSGGLVRVSWSQ